jgi:hypothetical protein
MWIRINKIPININNIKSIEPVYKLSERFKNTHNEYIKSKLAVDGHKFQFNIILSEQVKINKGYSSINLSSKLYEDETEANSKQLELLTLLNEIESNIVNINI